MSRNPYSRYLKLAGGSSVLCYTPGRIEVPLSLASAGGLVVVLEESPEYAACLMEEANKLDTLARFQIYLKTPEQTIEESFDYYNLIVIEGEKAMADPSVINLLAGRLFLNGILLLDETDNSDTDALLNHMKDAGLSSVSAVSESSAFLGLVRRQGKPVHVYGIQKEQPF